jgi:hypothetical protein
MPQFQFVLALFYVLISFCLSPVQLVLDSEEAFRHGVVLSVLLGFNLGKHVEVLRRVHSQVFRQQQVAELCRPSRIHSLQPISTAAQFQLLRNYNFALIEFLFEPDFGGLPLLKMESLLLSAHAC